MDDGCHFLVAEQESNQRSQHRGGADREVYRHFLNIPPLLPRLRAALPYVPLPAPIEGFPVVGMKVLGLIMKSTSTWLSTWAGRGSGGVLQSAANLVITMIAGGNHTTANWLKVGLKTRDKTAAAKGFADNASPGRFLWFVSCADTRNEHITVFGAEPTDR